MLYKHKKEFTLLKYPFVKNIEMIVGGHVIFGHPSQI